MDRQTSCSFYTCTRGLFERDDTSFSDKERQHFFRHHKQVSHVIALCSGRVVFKFTRQPNCNMRYVCHCGKNLASCDSLSIHVKGFQRPYKSQAPCREILRVADLLSASGPICCDDNITAPVSVWAYPTTAPSMLSDSHSYSTEVSATLQHISHISNHNINE